MTIAHSYDFDPTCGFSKRELQDIPVPDCEPADFVSFWEKFHKEVSSSKIQILSKREIWSPEASVDIWEVFFLSHGGVRIGAWVLRPEKSAGGLVNCHGYGPSPWFGVQLAKEGLTCIYPCIRGAGLSSHHDIPWEPRKHVLYRIDSKDEYVLKGCVADIWNAASVLLELFPDCADNLNYEGSSFGGGMGALSVPWDKRFKTASLDVPTFGNNPVRMKYKSAGSGEAQRLHLEKHPEAMAVMNYFDAAISAKYISAEVLCSPAYFDPVVLPVGQFAIANALKRVELYPIPVGHYAPTDPEHKAVIDKLPNKRRKLFGLPQL